MRGAGMRRVGACRRNLDIFYIPVWFYAKPCIMSQDGFSLPIVNSRTGENPIYSERLKRQNIRERKENGPSFPEGAPLVCWPDVMSAGATVVPNMYVKIVRICVDSAYGGTGLDGQVGRTRCNRQSFPRFRDRRDPIDDAHPGDPCYERLQQVNLVLGSLCIIIAQASHDRGSTSRPITRRYLMSGSSIQYRQNIAILVVLTD